jgi:hypothetical protein
VGELTGSMKTATVHCKGVAAIAAAGLEIKSQGSTIKLGVDAHRRLHVVAAQSEHAGPTVPQAPPLGGTNLLLKPPCYQKRRASTHTPLDASHRG